MTDLKLMINNYFYEIHNRPHSNITINKLTNWFLLCNGKESNCQECDTMLALVLSLCNYKGPIDTLWYSKTNSLWLEYSYKCMVPSYVVKAHFVSVKLINKKNWPHSKRIWNVIISSIPKDLCPPSFYAPTATKGMKLYRKN